MMNYILVVDDVGYTRALFKHAFTKEGYEVVCAESGTEALWNIAKEIPGLIILDINLPDITGIEILREIRSKRLKIPVIMVTARDSKEYLEETKLLGIYAFLTKPIDLNELSKITANILNPATHILIVDDEEDTVNLYARFLKDAGYRTSSCAEGQEAKMLLQNRNYDGVVLDLNLPGIDGIEILRFIRSQGSNIPVVITTGYASAETEQQLQEYQISGFMEKPIDGNELIKIFKDIFGTIRGRMEEDFYILALEGDVKNTNLFKSLIFNKIKQHCQRFVFDLTKATALSDLLHDTFYAIIRKEVIASRIVLDQSTQGELAERFPPTLLCDDVQTAKDSIITTLVQAIEEPVAAKAVKEEKHEEILGLNKVKGESYTIAMVSLENLEPGMVLAQNIRNESGKTNLFMEGMKLTQPDIDKIKNLKHVYSLSIKQKQQKSAPPA